MIVYDEKGRPRSNVKLRIDKPVHLVFNININNKFHVVNNSNYALTDNNFKVEDGESIEKDKILQCVFWNFDSSSLSSDGCITVTENRNEQYDLVRGTTLICIEYT